MGDLLWSSKLPKALNNIFLLKMHKVQEWIKSTSVKKCVSIYTIQCLTNTPLSNLLKYDLCAGKMAQ